VTGEAPDDGGTYTLIVGLTAPAVIDVDALRE
jgi:hypothetical protein